jgi:Asp-tRNA(Asn)/Glu-tRNA(Gln) amidotransferase A subunit family amidase
VRTAVEALCRNGFEVEQFHPEGLEEARKLWWKFFVVAGGDAAAAAISGTRSRSQGHSKAVFGMVRRLLEAWIGRDALRAQFFAQMRHYPILLCPTTAVPAFRHGERSWIIDGQSVHYLDAWSYAKFFNLLGNPAVVVPVGRSPEGLPIGVQIVGRPWEEEQVLGVCCGGRKGMRSLEGPADCVKRLDL